METEEKHLLIGKVGLKEYYWTINKDFPNGVLSWSVPEVRNAVIAPPGYKLLIADYSQVEVALMGEASDDDYIIDTINKGGDFHCHMAEAIYNIPYTELLAAKKDKLHPHHLEYVTFRADAKTITFLVPYGGGKQKMALQTGKTEEACQEIIDKYFIKAWKLKIWLDNQGEFAVKNGYTKSILGRPRFYRIPSQDSKDYNKDISQIKRYAGNQPIQSSSADMLKLALTKIYLAIRGGKWNGPRLYDAKIVLCVHDEIVILCADKDIEPVKLIMPTCMMDSYKHIIKKVKSKVDVIVSDYWTKD